MSNPYLPHSPPSTSTSTFSPSYNPYSPSPHPASASASAKDQPITRSRTLFYLSIRDSSAAPFSRRGGARGDKRAEREYGENVGLDDGEEGERLIGGREGWREVGMKELPPKWVDISEEVEEVLSRAKMKIAALDKLHAKHVLPGFTDRSAEEREIERQTTDITRDFRRCTSLVGSVQPARGAHRVEVVTAKNVQRGLAQKVQETSGMFRKKQRVYMQKLQGHAIKNKDLMVASGAITLKGTDVLDELQEDEQASQTQLQSQSQGAVAVDIDIQSRTNEITQIASSISELAELFRDLGNMIVEQGTVLDSVEYNVQQTARELDGAVEELKVARRYQANTGRRKCILFLVLCILGLILVLIYKPRGHSSAPVTSPDASAATGIVLPAESGAASGVESATGSGTSARTASASASRRPHLAKPPPLPTAVDEDVGW
ncbi:hypothetical protein IAT38_006931 [Cryptococcus sp. DSM 104549]